MIDLADLAPERIRPLRRAEYDRLIELGCFEDEKIELLGGVLVAMSPQGLPGRGRPGLLEAATTASQHQQTTQPKTGNRTDHIPFHLEFLRKRGSLRLQNIPI